MEWLTIGLLLFAGVQVFVQHRAERTRQADRAADREERLERAFQYAWAEHFRLESLADAFERFDLIELALLDVLQPSTVLPNSSVEFMHALTESGREAGVLGGVALGVFTDVERTVGIFVNSVKAFAREIPAGTPENEKPQWIRDHYGEDLKPWEKSIREFTKQVSLLMWDAVSHNPKANEERSLEFADDFASDFAKSATAALVGRSKGAGKASGG